MGLELRLKDGFKHDHMAYTMLKEDMKCDAGYQSTLAKAHAKDVSEVLEKHYIPANNTEKALFKEK